MAPGILDERGAQTDITSGDHAPSPFQPTGVLEKFDYEDVTPVIGREFPTLNIVEDLLNAPDADDLLRELAVTSTNSHHPLPYNNRSAPLTHFKSPAAVSSSFAPKTISPTHSKNPSLAASAA